MGANVEKARKAARALQRLSTMTVHFPFSSMRG